MKAFLVRYIVRVLFPTAVVYGALRLNASNFDETEVTTLWECFSIFNAFEIGMAMLPAKFAGRMRLPADLTDPASMRLAARAAVVGISALFCAVVVAIALDVRREVGGLREAFLSSDIETSWPEGHELHTLRTRHRDGWSTAEWLRAHVAELEAAQTEEPK